MSAKYTDNVWNYKTGKAEDKLLLLALADIADNKGNFRSSINELSDMTGIPNGAVSTILRHFLSPSLSLIALEHNESGTNHGQFSGKLLIGSDSQPKSGQTRPADLLAQAQAQHERLNTNKTPNQVKLNRSQRKQVQPLDPASREKQFSVLQIHMESIPDWAEGIMYTKGVMGRKEIWDALVNDVHASGEKIFSLAQLTSRLHQKIEFFKSQSFANQQSKARPRPVRQSALSVFEEKARKYLAEDDES